MIDAIQLNADNEDPMALARVGAIAEQVKRGQCILFLGAGVHRSPQLPELQERYRYRPADAPPTGRELAQILAGAGNENRPGSDNLQNMALAYQQAFGSKSLVDKIRASIARPNPSPALLALAELNFPIVVTTNYDRLFERALTLQGKEYTHCIYSSDENQVTRDLPGGIPPAEKPFLLKIHGDIDQPESMVITDDDYIHFVLRMSDKEQINPVPLGVRFFLRSWPTLFVGYSLRDYNLRLLFKTIRWRIDRANFPTGYAVDPSPDPALVKSLADDDQPQVFFIAQDVWRFVPLLYTMVSGKEMP